jgi:hypothetical protein
LAFGGVVFISISCEVEFNIVAQEQNKNDDKIKAHKIEKRFTIISFGKNILLYNRIL